MAGQKFECPYCNKFFYGLNKFDEHLTGPRGTCPNPKGPRRLEWETYRQSLKKGQ